MEQKQRPIILEMEEAKQELIQCVNSILAKHKLSCYLIEPMFAELYGRIQSSAQNEIVQVRAQEEEFKKAQVQIAETQVKDGAE